MSVNWSKLVTQTEKLVGGPAPFINLSHILSTEASALATRARKLAATSNHPILSAMRSKLSSNDVGTFKPSYKAFVPSSYSTIHKLPSGLVILLVGQLIGSRITPETLVRKSTVVRKHRDVAEIFETVRTALMAHRSLVDHSYDEVVDAVEGSPGEQLSSDFEIGNRLATLVGDLLLASASVTLASFENPKVLHVVATGIADAVEAEFSEFNEAFSHVSGTLSLPVVSTAPLAYWRDFVRMQEGSLLGACCESTVLLTTVASSKSANTISSQCASLAKAACEFGNLWGCLSRLVSECVFFKHLQTSLSDSTSWRNSTNEFHLTGFTVDGLLQPSLVDGFLLTGGSPTDAKRLSIEGYISAAEELTLKLRASLSNLLEHSSSPQAESLLTQAVCTLMDESKSLSQTLEQH